MANRPYIYKLEPEYLNFLEFTKEMIEDLKSYVKSYRFKSEEDNFNNIVQILSKHKPDEDDDYSHHFNKMVINFLEIPPI